MKTTSNLVVVNGTFVATVVGRSGGWVTVQELGTSRKDDYRASQLESLEPAVQAFAKRLQEAALTSVAAGEGFGRKAYLADACARLGTTPEACRTLLRAARGQLELCRADLVGAMPAAKLAASQVFVSDEAQKRDDIGATWHFVRA